MRPLPPRLPDRPGPAYALTGGTLALRYVLVRPVAEVASLFGGGRPLVLVGAATGEALRRAARNAETTR